MEPSFAIAGLGQMGAGLAHQALERGWSLVGYTRSGADEALLEAGLREAEEIPDLRGRMEPPRVVLLYVTAGAVVDDMLENLLDALEPGDVVVDGGNSYWGDSVRRHARLARAGLGFVDAGTSGGLEGARNGACFMVGGKKEHVRLVEPLLRDLSVPGGYVHAGGPGSGHFAKLVHNGIEFGMLQALGEGYALLERYDADVTPLAVQDTVECWRHGSVIRSWLVDLLARGLQEHGGLGGIPAHVEDTGEVDWLVSDSFRLEVPVPVIAQAVVQLRVARDADRDWSRAIAVMRRGFGGHPLGPDEHVAQKRRTGRIGAYPA